jgi:ASPIC and UnbV/FG-GAP-like repeat/Secretion system C-terminal sorting domain
LGVLKTTNKGETWQQLPRPNEFSVNSTYFLNEKVGFIAVGDATATSDSAAIYRTGDGGMKWEKCYQSPFQSRLQGIKFVNNLVGFALDRMLDDKIRIIKTIDGGNTWSEDFSKNISQSLIETFDKWDSFDNFALAVGRGILISNANFNNNLSLTTPTAFLSGTTNFCPNNTVQLRLDFSGTPPYSVILQEKNGTIIPLNNINTSPFYHTITPNREVSYLISSFTANNSIGKIGGSATFESNIPTSAHMFGEQRICYGQNTQNIKLILRGCPPFNVKIGDATGKDTFSFAGLQSDTIALTFKPKYSNENFTDFQILSATDATGRSISKLTSEARLFVYEPKLTLISSGGKEEYCEDEWFDIALQSNADENAVLTYFNGITTDTVKRDEFGRQIIKLKKSIAPKITLNTDCGTSSVQFRDTKTIRPVPDAPINFKAKNIDNRGVEITWTNQHTFAEFIGIARYDPIHGPISIGSVSSDATRYLDTTALQGETYYYFAAAVINNNCPLKYTERDSITLAKFFTYSPIPQPDDLEISVVWSHINADSLPDILGFSGSHINLGKNTFGSPNVLPSYGITRIEVADFDNDGDTDFLQDHIDNDDALILNINIGENRFEQKTIARGIVERNFFTWVDYNNDGWIDIVRDSSAIAGEKMTILINDKNGNFTPLPSSPFKEVAHLYFSDFDKDGDKDACAYGAEKTVIYTNQGNNNYVKTATFNTLNNNNGTFDGYFYDYDSDGDEDFIAYQNRDLYDIDDPLFPITVLKNTNGQFTEDKTTFALKNQPKIESVSLADFNNDGFIDLISVPNLYLNDKTNGYNPYTNKVFSDKIHYPFSYADADRDGDLDLAAGDVGTGIFTNDIPNKGKWLELRLEGSKSNRLSIGSYALIKARIGGQNRWQMRSVAPSKGFAQAKDDIVLHFGLGDAPIIDSIIIIWTSGLRTILTNITPNRYIKINEDGNVNTGCNQTIPSIKALNGIVRLCNQNGTVRLTSDKLATESIKWFRESGGVVQLVSTKDTLLLGAENESGRYSIETKDNGGNCPSVVSSTNLNVVIANPNITLNSIDSVICGTKYGSILPKTLNNPTLYTYNYQLSKNNITDWGVPSTIILDGTPLSISNGGYYRFNAISKVDISCFATSPNTYIRNGNSTIPLKGRVTMGNTSTPSVLSTVWLLSNGIIIDSTKSDSVGRFIFNINSITSYQIRAASSDNRFSTTYYGGTMTMSGAIIIRSTNCEAVDIRIPLQLKTVTFNTQNTDYISLPFPNPFDQTLWLNIESHNIPYLGIEIIDMLGKVQVQNRIYRIIDKMIKVEETEKLNSGIYLLKIQYANNIEFLKVVKR